MIAAVVFASASRRLSKYNTSKSVRSGFKIGSKLFSIWGVWSAIKSKSTKPTLFSSQRWMSKSVEVRVGRASTVNFIELEVSSQLFPALCKNTRYKLLSNDNWILVICSDVEVLPL